MVNKVMKSTEIRFLHKFMNQHCEILKIMKEHEIISISIIARQVHISHSQVINHIHRLIKYRYVEKIGRGKYKVIRFETPQIPLFEQDLLLTK